MMTRTNTPLSIARRRDMVGVTFGDWIVLREDQAKRKIKHFRWWICCCKCGFQKSFSTSYINANSNHSPQCENCRRAVRQAEDERLIALHVGRKYGDFTVVSLDRRTRFGSRRWLCRCACGKTRLFLSSYLYGNGTRRATRCWQCHNDKRELENRVHDHIPQRYWKRLQDAAKRRGITFGLSKTVAWTLFAQQDGRCALSGRELYFTLLRSNHSRYTIASLDRIDPQRPYMLGNVQWVHKDINLMKGCLDQVEFVNLCREVTTHNKEIQ